MPIDSTSRTLTWLHFSDLHANTEKTGWDALEVLDLLRKDMTQVREQHGLEPDLIFFTGDAAFGDDDPKKLAAQFDEAEILFDEIRVLFGVPRERFFIVPGNHDVHRESVTPGDTQRLDALLKDDKGLDIVLDMLRDQTTEWTRFVGRLHAYRAFLERYGYTHLLTDAGRLVWSWRGEVHDVTVAVAGLNTAWSCCRSPEKGHLWSGLRWQVQTLLGELPKDDRADVTVALTHHPEGWLNKFEDKPVENLLERRFDLRLHGHEHRGWLTEGDGHARIAAAACYARGSKERGYSFGRLDVDAGQGKVWLRRYDEEWDGWIPRAIPQKTTDDGVWTFHLRRPAPEVEAPRKERDPKPGPETRGVFGRDKDVRKLARLVSRRPLVSVYGLTGVGKTTLVAELLHTKEHAGLRYHRVLVRKETTFKGLFQQLAPALGASGDQVDESLAVLSHYTVLEKWTKKPTLVHLERADLLFDDTGGRFRDHKVGDLLAAVADKRGDVRIVLEGRRAPGKDVFAADVHEAMRVGGLGKEDLDAFLRTPQPSRTTVWTLDADAVAEVFERLGGGKRKGKAHPLGMVLLASLAAALGETPYDVVRRHPDAFAEELEREIFHEIYDVVLDDAKRRLLDLCALYRDEIPVRHEGTLQEHVGDGGEQAFDVLLRLCLLRPDAREERFTLHQMIADLVRRRHKDDDDDIVDGHHLVGKLWLGDAKGLRRLPQILAASEAVYHLVLGQGWELLADVQGRLLQDDVVAELREVSKTLHRQNKHQENRRVLELLVGADDGDVMGHRFLGEAIEKLEGRGAADAYPHYEAAYDLKPDFAPYVNNLMRYLEKDDPQRCVAIGEKAIADGVADDFTPAILANALEELGREDEASELRQERIDAGSQNAAVYNDEAVLLDRRGRKAEALSVLGLAFKRGIADQHIRAVRDRLVGGDAASASRQEAIRNGSTNPVHYNDEAVYLDELGRTEEALDVLRAAVERGIAADYTYAIQAKLLEKTGKADEASRLRRSRIDAGSHNPVFYNDEAILLDKQGRTEEALDVLRAAVDLGIANKVTAHLLRRMGG